MTNRSNIDPKSPREARQPDGVTPRGRRGNRSNIDPRGVSAQGASAATPTTITMTKGDPR